MKTIPYRQSHDMGLLHTSLINSVASVIYAILKRTDSYRRLSRLQPIAVHLVPHTFSAGMDGSNYSY